MADASVTLGLDADDFERRLAAAQSKLQSAGGQFESSFRRAGGASENLLTSSHRAARGIGNLAQQFAAGADASQLMGTGLMSLEHALRLPLGALAGLAIGAVFFEQLTKAQAESKKLHDELSALIAEASSGANFKTFDQLSTQLDKIRTKIGEVDKQQKSFMGRTMDVIMQTMPGGAAALERGKADTASGAHKAVQRGMKDQAQALAFQNLQSEKKQRDIPGSNLTPGLFSAERSEAAHKMMAGINEAMKAKNMALAAEEYRKYRIELTAIIAKEKEQQEKYADAVEMAKERTLIQTLELNGETELAKVLAAQLEYQRKINQEKRAGHPEIAAELQKQQKAGLAASHPATTSGDGNYGSIADRWKDDQYGSIARRWKGDEFGSIERRWNDLGAGMQSIKPDQKQDFKNALTTAESILKDIEKNTGKFDFKNH